MSEDEEDWPWDAGLAERLDGATILVGLTSLSPTGDTYEQFYGTVISIEPRDCVTLRLEGSRAGELYRLPADLDAFHPADPGRYTLRGSNDVVNDPDYTTTWTITKPSN